MEDNPTSVGVLAPEPFSPIEGETKAPADLENTKDAFLVDDFSSYNVSN